MEKVKVTKEQEQAIKQAIRLHGEDYVVDSHCLKQKNGLQWNLGLEALNDFETWQLAKAVYIGYEIEPEFKTKDFVVYHNAKHERRIGEIIDIQYEHNRVQFYLTSNWRSIDDIIRHATESEIKQEKERRWWAKHNRIINEYKTADLVIHENRTGIWEVTGGAGDNVTITNDFADSEQQVISKHLKLICPAENRLDLSN